MNTDDLTSLLTFYSRRLTDLVIPSSRLIEATHKAVIETTREEISRVISADIQGWERTIARRAGYFWAEAPFKFDDIRIRQIYLSLTRSWSEYAAEKHRHKGVIWIEASVYDRSRIGEFVNSEMALLKKGWPTSDDAVQTVRFSDGCFDMSARDFDRMITSPSCEWLWFVWDSFDSITDEVRDALWQSSYARLHRDVTRCQVREQPLDDTLRETVLLSKHKWTELPLSLLERIEAPK